MQRGQARTISISALQVVMQIKLKIIIFGIVGLFLLSAFFAYADDDRNPLLSSYWFFLYYDNGQLVADRDFEFTYDVVPETFVPEAFNTQFPYKGEIINLNNQVAETFQFDPRRGDPKFLKGKISVKAPYVSDGQKAVFYDAQGNPLLTIFVSESSFCNDDGVCNTNNGEDEKTCPADCKGVAPLPTVTEGPAGGLGGMLMTVIYVLIIAGAAAGGWFGWKWYKGRQAPPPTNSFPPIPQNPSVQ